MRRFLVLILLATVLFAAKERYDLVKIKITDPKQIKTLETMGALIHDVKDGIARVEIPFKDFAKFESQGFEILEVIFPDISSYYAQNEQAYHTYEGFRDSLILLAQNYPNIAKVETLGFSTQNRVVLAIKITENPQVRSPRPRCLFEGATHGNEKIGAEVAFALARYLILNYGNDPLVTNLVNTRETWVAPLVNPDGYVASTRGNANGIDCNRDYGYMWDEGWGSPGPFSQVEPRNFRNFAENHQLTHWCSYHSGTEFISYPWSYTPQRARDWAALDTLARHCHNYTGYPYNQGYQGMYEIHGSSKDFAYGAYGPMSWTCEVSEDYIPPVGAIDSICNLNRPAQLYMITKIGHGIRGIVTDSITGEPLKAMISVSPPEWPVYTDSLGDYHRFVLPGTYSITAWANGYQPKTISDIVVPPDTYVTVDFALVPDTQAPVAGFKVTMVNDQDNEVITSGTYLALGLHDSRRYSLGVGGWIVIDMGEEVINGSGYDFTVYENDADPEGYAVYVGTNWNGPFTYIGSDTGTASFDMASGGVNVMRYVKIVDDGDGSQTNPTAGLDLDAIEATVFNAPALVLTQMVIIDSLGNNNGRFDPGEIIDLQLMLRNFGPQSALDVIGRLSENDPYVEILDSIAIFGDIPPGATVLGEPFTLSALAQTPREHIAEFTLYLSDTLGYEDSLRFSITIGEIVATDPIPDGPRTPPLFWAYDNVDTLYPQHPTYEWIEIKTIGTRLTLSDDQTVQITLPASFGPWKFYNQRFTQLSICSNGWIAPGYQTSTAYSNRRIPDATSTNPNGMVCANWDDLIPNNSGVGGVYYYHDVTNHRFIIEYDSVPYFGATSMDKFEIIIYDTILAPEDGHNEIIVQYQTANRWNSSTVGIEDPTNQIAICCLFNDTLHRGAAPWTPGKAIKYTTRQAVSIAELNSKDIAPMLIFQPNPFRNRAKIAWTVNKPTFTHINIYDYSGRLVRNLFNEYLLKPGVYFINWDGKNNCGEKVSSGIYFIRLETEFGTRIFKTIKLNQD
ncbi:MAG: M14 family zinc carboxypeptidase [candidate division WOR-3 bacterium]